VVGIPRGPSVDPLCPPDFLPMHSSFHRLLSVLLFSVLVPLVQAEDPPKVLGDYLRAGVETRGEMVAVIPPEEIKKYLDLIKAAGQANPEWFKEYEKTTKPGIPLPYHENLGLTKEQYAEYLVLWGKREMKPVPNGAITLRLESPKKGEWVIRASGTGSHLSLLRYVVKEDVVNSPNGALARLKDVDAKKESVLGAWTGHEWKFEEEDFLRTKENFAIGKVASGKFGLIVYRLQEISGEGVLLYDRRMLIRFPIVVK